MYSIKRDTKRKLNDNDLILEESILTIKKLFGITIFKTTNKLNQSYTKQRKTGFKQ